jgi:IclR family mhp operon transcriptional activator
MAIDDRLLRILRAFNVLGVATILELARETKISRPAIYRVVNVLCNNGYVRAVAGTSAYKLTSLVRTLSSGYREEAWISEVGAEAIGRLQERIIWPTSLAVPECGHMVVRETTRFRSPYVFDMGTVGMQLSVYRTALGLAYFAFSSPETQGIINRLVGPEGANSLPSKNQLRIITRRGFAARVGGVQPKTSSIAVPILSQEGAIASVCVTYAKGAIASSDAVKEFVPLLQTVAAQIRQRMHST